MLTYNNARDDVLKKQGRIYSLRQNHRSVKELVSVVDELFQRQPAFGEKVIYDPVIARFTSSSRLNGSATGQSRTAALGNSGT